MNRPLITIINRENCQSQHTTLPEVDSSIATIQLTDNDGKRKSQSTLLIEIGSQGRLIHDTTGDAYVEIEFNDAKSTIKIRSKEFAEYLGSEFYKLTGKGASEKVISDAKNTLEAMAKYDGECAVCAVRAHKSNNIYIDLGSDNHKVIEITPKGRSITNTSSIKFIRKRGMMSLPLPIPNGDVMLLQKHLNIKEDDFALVIGFLLCALGGLKPYPILIFQGEQGTGKSTNTRVIRELCDPSSVPLRTPPKDIRDLLVSAGNTHLVALDNLSGLKHEISDALCRLSTGGGIDVRALYTDDEQHLLDIQKPVMINGIDDIACRPDLTERSLILNLPIISNTNRKTEKEIWKEFQHDKQCIFSGLLDGLVSGLKDFDNVHLDEKPRLADAAQWITACEIALGMKGGFVKAHKRNQLRAIADGIEASPVGSAICKLMEDKLRWSGVPTELESKLCRLTDYSITNSQLWPQSLKGLRNIIKRLTPSLRLMGIIITKKDTHKREYIIENKTNYPPEAHK